MKFKEFYKNFLKISEPYSHQEQVWKIFENWEKFNFPLLVKAPTGSGKTEALIAPFLNQFLENNFFAPRLIYVLPMRVLADSIAKRIEGYAKKVSPYISVQIQHGDTPNSPFFIDDIIVTTLDQFLYGFARTSKQVGKHIDLPAGSIASSIVVFDEAHMYRDEFTFSIMRAIMEILYQSKIPFILMTATMPQTLEKSLFENIPLDTKQKIFGEVPFYTTVNIKIEKKPLVIENGELNIPDSIFKLIKKHKTLIVLNQVKKAQKVYEEIKKRLKLNNDQIVLLHSRFTRLERRAHEYKALSLLPQKKNGEIKVPKGVGVVVSTQVLEAGIDFSAELLLTELAPADSLIQRAGRCARYNGEKGEMIIFPVEDDKGHLPYEKESLTKTLEWLKRNRNFNIRDFNQVVTFVDETLDYQANDYEANDTLIDLYECVLYADSEPKNIQLRKNKSAKVIVVEPKIGEKKRENKETQLENGIKEILKNNRLGDYAFEVDIKVLWGWYKDGLIRYELKWEEKEKEKYQPKVVAIKEKVNEKEEEQNISPFKTYILESSLYNSEKGVDKDAPIYI
ncbi:MAG: CRISPR-associated helicase Cas3' [candidate division WOR-3 bacterium]